MSRWRKKFNGPSVPRLTDPATVSRALLLSAPGTPFPGEASSIRTRFDRRSTPPPGPLGPRGTEPEPPNRQQSACPGDRDRDHPLLQHRAAPSARAGPGPWVPALGPAAPLRHVLPAPALGLTSQSHLPAAILRCAPWAGVVNVGATLTLLLDARENLRPTAPLIPIATSSEVVFPSSIVPGFPSPPVWFLMF